MALAKTEASEARLSYSKHNSIVSRAKLLFIASFRGTRIRLFTLQHSQVDVKGDLFGMIDLCESYSSNQSNVILQLHILMFISSFSFSLPIDYCACDTQAICIRRQ